MADDARLKDLLIDILLLDDAEYRDEVGPDDVGTWDSLATVRIGEAIHSEFGYRMLPEELVTVESIGDIKSVLRQRRVFA
jgi:acyl carrier protein